ncbi:MAG TPA: hypothetical protein VM163_09550 [bacterium]|nr:hypothetical protein [bacterium]
MQNNLEDTYNMRCPLCGGGDIKPEDDLATDRCIVTCGRCHKFRIRKQAWRFPPSEDTKRKLHLLSGLARELSEHGGMLKIESVRPDKIDELLSGRVPTTVQEKIDRLLQGMAKRSEHPGAEFRIDKDNDYPLAYAKNGTELGFFLEHLENSGLALIGRGGSTAGPFRLTTKGWERVEKLKESRATSTKVFVAMHFTKALEDLYDLAIKPGIAAAGYGPVRVDREDHIGKADDYIIAQIKESRFMVADMTDQRQSVYFEAGYAMGLGLRIIWLCRDDDMKNLHFDIQQYNHLPWKQGEWLDLKDRLRYRIEATIDRGPARLLTDKSKSPNPV